MDKKTRERKAKQSGRIGGLIGGRRRADSLTPARRQEIARLAAQTRWHPQLDSI